MTCRALMRNGLHLAEPCCIAANCTSGRKSKRHRTEKPTLKHLNCPAIYGRPTVNDCTCQYDDVGLNFDCPDQLPCNEHQSESPYSSFYRNNIVDDTFDPTYSNADVTCDRLIPPTCDLHGFNATCRNGRLGSIRYQGNNPFSKHKCCNRHSECGTYPINLLQNAVSDDDIQLRVSNRYWNHHIDDVLTDVCRPTLRSPCGTAIPIAHDLNLPRCGGGIHHLGYTGGGGTSMNPSDIHGLFNSFLPRYANYLYSIWEGEHTRYSPLLSKEYDYPIEVAQRRRSNGRSRLDHDTDEVALRQSLSEVYVSNPYYRRRGKKDIDYSWKGTYMDDERA